MSTNAVDNYNKLARKYGGLPAHQFAVCLAEVHYKFLNANHQGNILCAVVGEKDKELVYMYVSMDPVHYVKDKYAIMRNNGIRDGDVFLPLEFKHLLH